MLDDDPTGTQTVAGVAVLTEWSVASLAAELRSEPPVFYVLTNSRALPLEAASRLNREIAANLTAASRAAGRGFVVVSRSDSTLRGHYPGEVDALAAGLGGGFDGVLIVPFFLEGGRYTIDDVHYVADGDVLTPAAETEFARDSVFGYGSSDLREWVSEKHGGALAPRDVDFGLADNHPPWRPRGGLPAAAGPEARPGRAWSTRHPTAIWRCSCWACSRPRPRGGDSSIARPPRSSGSAPACRPVGR